MSNEPAVRARHLQTFVRCLDELPAHQREGILAFVPGDDLLAIEQSSTLSWLPIGVSVRLFDAAFEALPAEAAHGLFRRFMHVSADTPLMGAFVQGTLRLVGALGPATALRRIPTGVALLFRNVGEWDVREEGARTVVLHLAGLPPEAAASRAWAEAWRSTVSGVFDIMELPGEVVLRAHDPAARSFTLEARC